MVTKRCRLPRHASGRHAVLPDGTRRSVVLNPLGVPSHMEYRSDFGNSPANIRELGKQIKEMDPGLKELRAAGYDFDKLWHAETGCRRDSYCHTGLRRRSAEDVFNIEIAGLPSDGKSSSMTAVRANRWIAASTVGYTCH